MEVNHRYRSWIRLSLFICILLYVFGFQINTSLFKVNEAVAVDHAESEAPVYVIPVKQTIESGLEQFLRRAFSEAEQAGAQYIILDIATLGGPIDAALDIGELIVDSSIPTVAYIHGKAISAGSFIALNADQIVMQRGSIIGAAAVVDLAGDRVETDSKVVSAWLSAMTGVAEMNHRNPEYAKGMVLDDLVIEVPEINRTFGSGELISFSAEEAVKAGYAEAIAQNLHEVKQFLNVTAAPTVTMELSTAEKIARFLANPWVMTILFVVGLAGIAIEVFAPGFGLPGILGISSFALYFFGNYVAGFAEIEHILMFVAGIVLLLVEIFLPSFGIIGIIGIICLIAGIVLAASNTGNALLSLLVAFIFAIIVIIIVARFFKYKGIWNKFILKDQMTSEHGYNSVSVKTDLIGKRGTALSPLRPAGTALIDGERIDVVSGGDFIEKSAQIEVYKVEGTRIVVKKI